MPEVLAKNERELHGGRKRFIFKTMSKCGVCDKWFLTGEKIVYLEGTAIHASCNNSEEVDSNGKVINGGGAMQTPTKAHKLSMEEHITEFSRARYVSEDLLEELSVKLKARFPLEDIFEANVKKVVRPCIVGGLPADKQELINMSRKKAISLGIDAERHNAMTKVLRILNSIRYHCYRGYPPEDDEEEGEEGKKDSDLNNVPIANAVAKEVVTVVARKLVESDEESEVAEEEEDTQEYDNLSQQLSQIHLGKLKSHNLQRKHISFLIFLNR